MRNDAKNLLHLLAVTVSVSGCGPDSPAGYRPETHGKPAEGYIAPTEGCPPGARAVGLPTLPLPWNFVTEVYLSSAGTVPGFAFDYDVAPLANVERVGVTFDYDPGSQPESTTIDGRCPSSIASSTWSNANESNDVVAVRIGLDGEESAERAARLSFPVGTHTYALDISSIPSAERHGPTFVVFDPSWGRSRIAIVPVALSPDEDIVEISGLPRGVGHIAVVRAPAVERLEPYDAYVAPSGFAAEWTSASDFWVGALVSGEETHPIRLSRYRAANEALAHGALWAHIALPRVAATPLRFVSFGPGESEGQVELACEQTTAIDVPFRAKVSVEIDSTTQEITAGARATLDVECADGAQVRTVGFRIESETNDGWVVLREQ